MTPRLTQKLANLKRALNELNDYCKITNPSKVERAGIIQGFEFTFELFWKTFKAAAEEQGSRVDSPKGALKKAYQSQLIDDESLWLQMLNDRNETSHIYNEALAVAIYGRIVHQYLGAFHKAATKLENA